MTLCGAVVMLPPDAKSWRLNERHYGALQGLNKQETANKYGADQVGACGTGHFVHKKSDNGYA